MTTTTQLQPKGKHGGARPGTGPKPRPELRKRRLVTSLPPRTADALQEAAGDGRGAVAILAAKIIADYFEKNA